MSSKFILSGTDNNGIRHRYSVVKNEEFKKAFIKFMTELGFDPQEIDRGFSYIETLEDGTEQHVFLKVAEIIDVCWYYKNQKYEVDVFFGKEKIILVVRTNQKDKMDGRINMIKHLELGSDWQTIKEPVAPRVSSIKTGRGTSVSVGSYKK